MDDPWIKAVEKLFELTESGVIRWSKAPVQVQRSGLVGIIYTAETSGKKIVLYEEKSNHGGFIGNDSHVVIEFVDKDWNSEWSWPGMSESWRLLESVRFQVAAGKDFLTELLSK